MFNLFGGKICPIGIDLGSHSLKMLQLAKVGAGWSLVAAAEAPVPGSIAENVSALQEWRITTIKRLLAAKPFKTRKVVTCLPSREILVQHLRVATMGEEELKKALPWEAQEKLPFDTQQAMLRHIVAGEVYDGDESKLEVILMAASRAALQRHLNLIERTKLEIKSIGVEPCALVNSFAHLLGQAEKIEGATILIDLGHTSSKVVIAHGPKVVFARTLDLGARQMIHAVGKGLQMGYEQATRCYENLGKGQRADETAGQSAAKDHASMGESFHGAADTATTTLEEKHAKDVEADQIQAILASELDNLCEEIRSCVRYHNLLFEAQAVARVIFVGGQGHHRALCQKLAQGLKLPAQLGDPLARVAPQSLTGAHSDLQAGRRHCQWAVAFGLSMGTFEAN